MELPQDNTKVQLPQFIESEYIGPQTNPLLLYERPVLTQGNKHSYKSDIQKQHEQKIASEKIQKEEQQKLKEKQYKDQAQAIETVSAALSPSSYVNAYRLYNNQNPLTNKQANYLDLGVDAGLALVTGGSSYLAKQGIKQGVKQTAKQLLDKPLLKIDKDVVAKITHPTYKKYYHGSPYPFDITKAWTGTRSDIGLHMGDKNVAERMAGKDGIVYEFYAPRPQLETIDKGNNDIELFVGTISRPALNGNSYYFANKRGKKYIDLLKKGDATFISENSLSGKDFYRVTIQKDINVPSKEINWPNMPKNIENELNYIKLQRDNTLQRLTNRYAIKEPEPVNGRLHDPDEWNQFQLRMKRLQKLSEAYKARANSQASKVLHDNNINVVQYWNNNAMETSKKSYFLTDPSVIYQPKDIIITGRDLYNSAKKIGKTTIPTIPIISIYNNQ